MTAVMRQRIDCANLNHRRTAAPVSHCPQCGAIVNRHLPRRSCSEEQHALSRRRGSVFCAGCGTQLIVRQG